MSLEKQRIKLSINLKLKIINSNLTKNSLERMENESGVIFTSEEYGRNVFIINVYFAFT
jgi:hypothetical protein